MVVEAGGQEALEQLEGHDGCQAPDGVRRPKINRHAVPRMTLKSGRKKSYLLEEPVTLLSDPDQKSWIRILNFFRQNIICFP